MRSATVYHGTNCAFDSIDLSRSRDNRDFGRGFYTTTIASQAESWAKSVVARRGGGSAIVHVYEFHPVPGLSVCEFDGLTLEWLDFVKVNRISNSLVHDFDIVSGPVANDNTLLTVNRYMQGVYTTEEALRRLAYFKANDQVSFHTTEAIRCLHLARRYEVER